MIKTEINLIPNIVNPTPDYYCTWQTQLYATSGGNPEAQRAIIGEKALFDSERPYGWAHFHKEARRDLLFVMDDSWDVPLSGDPAHFGSLILNEEKFPREVKCSDSNVYALKRLTETVQGLGWKGLGGWVCARDLPEEYLIQRLKDAHEAGFAYWKVDWGEMGSDTAYRRILTSLGKRYAPFLTIEHAINADVIPYSDVFRTYDVPAVMSIPMTLEKLAALPRPREIQPNAFGLINCEDEAYIAAAGGFSMGIMRHPYSGALPSEKADMSFPQVHRDIKTKMYEVVRAARWHRVAPAFSIAIGKFNVDENTLSDSWSFINHNEEIESWWLGMPIIQDHINGDLLTKTAPARLSRGCRLPEVSPDFNGDVPYVVASMNPSGAYSVATLGRTRDREYFIPRCDISINTENAKLIGVFGEYNNLTINTTYSCVARVLMQDISNETAYDITNDITVNGNNITVPGTLIQKIGTSAQPSTDTSEPGAVIKLVN